jgi:HSP20 family molecular chaperone IbpA
MLDSKWLCGACNLDCLRGSQTTLLIKGGNKMSNLVRYTTPSLLGRSLLDELFPPNTINSLIKRSTQGYPVADIYSNEDGSTTLEFALAGFDKKDLSIEIEPEKNILTVRAEANGDGDSNRRIARRSFQKTFVNYDSNLDLLASTAEFHNGLLSITIPRITTSQPVIIDIN